MRAEELARFMHFEYERFAQKHDWDTQEPCKVAFDDLPENNKKTMLCVAKSVLAKIGEVTNENKRPTKN